MTPVYRTKPDGLGVNIENEIFGKYTPNGEFTAYIANPEAIKQFKPGQEWYFDLTLAE